MAVVCWSPTAENLSRASEWLMTMQELCILIQAHAAAIASPVAPLRVQRLQELRDGRGAAGAEVCNMAEDEHHWRRLPRANHTRGEARRASDGNHEADKHRNGVRAALGGAPAEASTSRVLMFLLAVA